MLGELPKQAFAAREAHEALLDLKKIVDEATETAHSAELESFHLAATRSGDRYRPKDLTRDCESSSVAKL
jgi:hypothetical protein